MKRETGLRNANARKCENTAISQQPLNRYNSSTLKQLLFCALILLKGPVNRSEKETAGQNKESYGCLQNDSNSYSSCAFR